ncbi:FUSC family protein [Aliivibrio logei]|uniref:FUSC family protein n=1 Tax=Aliivibrio logei TaxID=688 RepID=UPI000685AF85|nr:FUSC family protein [Aliivibrio logei]
MRLWYSPSINLGCRITSIIIFIFLVAFLCNQMSVAVTLIMTFAAAFISGLDTAGSKRWQRFFITSAMWSLALVITYGLLQLQIPYWVVFFIAAILFSIPAINGPFWARLGMSCLVIAAMTFSLYRSDAAGYQYPFLIFGPLIFSLCSWLWFAVWKNFALKVCVSAIYNDLANYIQLRENVLSGKQYDDVEIRNNKHALVGLLRQAFQSEAFMSKKHNEALIFTDLYLAQDLFEIILSSHTTNPALLEQFKTDPEKHAALVNWSQECQALLQTKSLQILSNAKREAVSSSLLEKAEQLAGLVKQEGSSRIEHWAYTIVHISQRIVDDKPVYDRSYQIQPFEFTWRWPTLTHPIWRYVFRVGVIFSVGTGIAEYYDVTKPEWVVLTMIMVMQPSFLATKSRICQRCLGTILGGGLAILILKLGLPVFVLGGIVLFLLPFSMLNIMKNYSLAIGGITMLLIITYQLLAHQGLDIVFPRLQDTVLGSLVVLIGSSILWPQWRGKEIRLQAIKGIESAQDFLLYANHLLFNADEKYDVTMLGAKRAALLTAESDLELVFSEMQKEPQYTHIDIEYYEELLVLYRQLSHYLCLLVPLVRHDVKCEALSHLHPVIERATEELLSAIKTGEFSVNPMINHEMKMDTGSLSTKEQSIYELVWLSLMMIEGMNDIVISKINAD